MLLILGRLSTDFKGFWAVGELIGDVSETDEVLEFSKGRL